MLSLVDDLTDEERVVVMRFLVGMTAAIQEAADADAAHGGADLVEEPA